MKKYLNESSLNYFMGFLVSDLNQRNDKESKERLEHFDYRSGQLDLYNNFIDWESGASLKEDNLRDFLIGLYSLEYEAKRNNINVNDIIRNNGGEIELRGRLNKLLFGQESIQNRWYEAQSYAHFGPGVTSEILCRVYPTEYAMFNSRTRKSLEYLGVSFKDDSLSDWNTYQQATQLQKEIVPILEEYRGEKSNLFQVDGFFQKYIYENGFKL